MGFGDWLMTGGDWTGASEASLNRSLKKLVKKISNKLDSEDMSKEDIEEQIKLLEALKSLKK